MQWEALGCIRPNVCALWWIDPTSGVLEQLIGGGELTACVGSGWSINPPLPLLAQSLALSSVKQKDEAFLSSQGFRVDLD